MAAIAIVLHDGRRERFILFPGGHSNDKRGYQACPWTNKNHPKHILPELKFAPLNMYSAVGFDTHKQAFFYFFNPEQVHDAIILLLNKYSLENLSNTKFYKSK